MSENETAIGDAVSAEPAVNTNETATAEVDANQTAGAAVESNQSAAPAPASTEEISYHAVEKDGVVTAIWEMQGRKHVRTIDPRSRQGREILSLYTTEHHDESQPSTGDAAASE